MAARFSLILFDLDGTLVDTVPDLGGAVNRMLQEDGLPPLPLEAYRPYVSLGAQGLLQKGFGIFPDDVHYREMYDRFTRTYAAHICDNSCLFEGMAEILAYVESQGLPWGIVTNKRQQFTLPLMQSLKLTDRAACLVSGDTVAEAKPSPLPMLHALMLCGGQNPENTLYIGDDLRDVLAGKAAGMKTAAVTFGYARGDGPAPAEWNADYLFDSPAELLAFLQQQTLAT